MGKGPARKAPGGAAPPKLRETTQPLSASRAAAEMLAAEGIDAEVMDPRTIRPLDTEGLAASVKKTGRCVVAEEGHLHGGVGAEFVASLQQAAFASLKAPIGLVAALDVPIPVQPKLEAFVLPSAEKIAAAAREALKG